MKREFGFLFQVLIVAELEKLFWDVPEVCSASVLPETDLYRPEILRPVPIQHRFCRNVAGNRAPKKIEAC